LKREPCYKTVPRKKTISCVFLNLVDNIQEYNTGGISIVWESLCKIYVVVISKGHVIAGDRYTDQQIFI